jgi:hypothetical protein
MTHGIIYKCLFVQGKQKQIKGKHKIYLQLVIKEYFHMRLFLIELIVSLEVLVSLLSDMCELLDIYCLNLNYGM